MDDNKHIEFIAQNRDNFNEPHIREICKSSTINRDLLFERSSFFGNFKLTKFLLFKLKVDWSEEQLRKAFKNAIVTDDADMVKIVLKKCRDSSIDVETTEMKDLAEERGKTAILKLLNVPVQHLLSPSNITITKNKEFDYVNVTKDIASMVQEREKNEMDQIFVPFTELLDNVWLKEVHYEDEKCPDDCKQNIVCQRCRDVIKLLEFIVKEISKNHRIYENVQVEIIGSIKETSRVGTIDEADTLLLLSRENEDLLRRYLEYNRVEQKIKIRKRFFDHESNSWAHLEPLELLAEFVSTEGLTETESEHYYGNFDESKYFLTFIEQFYQVVKEYPEFHDIPGLKLSLDYTPCDICEDKTNLVKKHVRCRHHPGCEEHQKIEKDKNYQEQCNCKVFTSPSLSYSKIGS